MASKEGTAERGSTDTELVTLRLASADIGSTILAVPQQTVADFGRRFGRRFGHHFGRQNGRPQPNFRHRLKMSYAPDEEYLPR